MGTIQGTGLGLAITKHAVEIHGGRIVVQSLQEQGTTFMVVIPNRQNIGDELEEVIVDD